MARLPVMKTILGLSLVFALTACAQAPAPVAASAPIDEATRAPSVEVFFSPKGGCTDKVVSWIGKSKSIRVSAYSFTSKPIIAALIAAQKRSGDVKVVLDREDQGLEPANQLIAAGVPVWFDLLHAIAHQKIMIFDGQVIEEGSFNYTQQAETSNSENCNFIHISSVAQTYLTNWTLHQGHSIAATPPAPAPSP